MLLSVVIPVYNEEKTLAQLIERVRAIDIDKQLVLVDDCSTDGTRALLKKYEDAPDCKVLYHEKNQGKGAALRTGFGEAQGDLVIVQDADMEYDPAEYPRLIQPIIEGKADVVYGTRYGNAESHLVLGYWHSIGNKSLTMLSNMLSNLDLSDMETCYKVFKREIIQKITIEENRFGFEPEITAKLAKMKGVRVFEVAISYHGRSFDEGKKIGWKDGVSAVWCILKYNLRRGGSA